MSPFLARAILMSLLLVLFAMAPSSAAFAAEPRILIAPEVAPAVNQPLAPKLGASPDGFLLSAMPAHRPIAIPLSPEGEPRVVGTLPLAQESTTFIGAPVFDGTRWLVPYAPNDEGPETTIAILDRAGRTVTGSATIPARYRRLPASLSWNGRVFALIQSFIVDGRFTIDGVILSPDLVPTGDSRIVATGVIDSRLAAMPDGFLLVYSSDDGLWAQRLDDEGMASGAASRIQDAPPPEEFEIAAGPDGVLIAWSEESGGESSLRAAVVPSTGEVEQWGEIATMREATWTHAFPARLDDGWVIAWQTVTHLSNQEGNPIVVQRFSAAGAPRGAPEPLIASARGEVLRAVASNGDAALFAFDRQTPFSVPFFGVLVTSESVSAPRAIHESWQTIRDVSFAAPGDGRLYGAWVEQSGVEGSVRLGRWSAEGELLGESVVRSAEGVYGEVSLAWGPGHGILVWIEGFHLLGILVDDQARPVGDFFFIRMAEPDSHPFLGEPRIVWDGSRFIVTWRGGGAFLTAGIPSLEIADPPPSPNENHSFTVESTRLASTGDRLAVVSGMKDRPDCYFPTCDPGEDWLAISFTSGSGPVTSWDELIPFARAPAIATSGQTFLLSFLTAQGVHIRTYGLTGELLAEEIMFRGPMQTTTAEWDGSRYIVAWSHRFGGKPRVTAAQFDQEGRLSAPLLGFEFGGDVHAAPLGGDVMLIGRATIHEETAPRTAIVGGLLSEGEILPPPPAAPAVEVQRRPESVIVTWTPAPGLEYRVLAEHESEGMLSWQSIEIHQGGRAVIYTGGRRVNRILVEAIGLGGASAREISLSPVRRTRTVGR